MARHQYGNTETSDLWDALEAETGEPVRRIAESWIFQGGFPELVVGEGAGGGLSIGQRRFYYSADGTGERAAGGAVGGGARGSGGDGAQDHLGGASEATEARWSVPVVLGTRTGGAGDGTGGGTDEHRVAQLVDAEPVTVAEAATWPWVNANFGAHGFYRVRYDRPLLESLLDNLADLTPLERYTLVDDAWASVLAGSTDAASYLDTIERFADERDLSVWERITAGLGQVDRLVEGDARVALHSRVAALIGPARAELGADARPGDDDRTRTLRGVLLQTAALLGDDGAARRRARELLDRFLDHPPSVDPSLAAPALAVSATLGDAALHERLTAGFRASDNPQDRQRLLFSLARFRDPEAFRRTLDLSLSDDVRTQDAPYLLGSAIDNRDNGPAAWEFVAEHWADVQKRFPANSLARLVGGIRGLRDRALGREVEAFLADHPIPQGELQVRQHVERMWITVALAERESSRLAAALSG
jgi:puromycin-sensitive aminopeptidase